MNYIRYSSRIIHHLEQQYHQFFTKLLAACRPNISAHGAVKKAFQMSPAIRPIIFFTAIIKINLTDMSLMVD